MNGSRPAAGMQPAARPRDRHLESDNSNTSGASRLQARSHRSPQRVYLLRLQSGADIQPLRAALKVLKRRFGLICRSIVEEERR
jgi:hypothetical protein